MRRKDDLLVGAIVVIASLIVLTFTPTVYEKTGALRAGALVLLIGFNLGIGFSLIMRWWRG